MSNAANSFVNSERLITKVYFPRLAVPLAAVGAAIVDFAIASLLLGAMMMWRGIVPGPGNADGADHLRAADARGRGRRESCSPR